jgi:CheY-like chemotaxis protein
MNKQRPILLVEDNPDDAELVRLAFERNGITNPLIVKRDGVEALEFLFNPENQTLPAASLPQVAILDLKLPRVSGLEVLQRIRAAEGTRTLPVVILTSSNQQSDVLEAYRLGANAYVCKPVDFNNYVPTLARLGLFWLTVEHPSDHA